MENYTDIDLGLLPRVEAKSIRCLYFLFKEEKLVYIGKSINLFGRIGNHLTEQNKKFDSFRYLEVPDLIDLDVLERMYILKYTPEYNIQIKAKYERELISIDKVKQREEIRKKKRELEEDQETDFLFILSEKTNIIIKPNG